MVRNAVCAMALVLLGMAVTQAVSAGSNRAHGKLTFERDIRPILKAHCFQCHGEGETLKGGVDLRLRRLMLSRSESGPVLVPGKPESSQLWHMVSTGEMPKGEKKLSAEALEKLRQWIRQGAPTVREEPALPPRFWITEEERNYWAFQPLRNPPVPRVRNAKLARNEIDRFLLASLEARKLRFASEADRRTLMRRVVFDLTGLIPSPSEVEGFVADPAEDAYERLVERLLDSPHYGERWGRHWLDVVGYADSNGGIEADSERPWAWRYRDYVIRSFNADKAFDLFVKEQLAGDEMLPRPMGEITGEKLEKLSATGFLRMAPDPTGDGAPDADLARNQVIADTMQIVSSSLLGLTVHCAQCHDHRYDPIPQMDYYRLRAVFEPAFDWKQWRNPAQRHVSLMPKTDREAAECVETSARVFDEEARKLHDELIEVFVQKQLLLVPEALRQPVMAARRTPADKRTEDHKRLLRDFPTFQDHIILGEIDVEGAKRVEEIRQRASRVRESKPVDPMVHALVEEPGKNPPTFLFHRGDHQQPKEKTPPGGLAVLASLNLPAIPETNATLKTTGRRLAFAEHLMGGGHPLPARVWVNRVWHHYFGRGIVASLGDFGMLGERPSHPELLDWLASDFIAGGWKLKALHRKIVLSAVYRQSSVNESARKSDPDNRLLGRMNLRRRDAESLRDSILLVSGRLATNMFGPSVPVAVDGQGQFVVGKQSKDRNGDPNGVGGLEGEEFRRTLYVQVRRTMPVGVLEAFDAPALNPNCEVRPVSTAPTQALMLMNNSFVLERSMDLADAVRKSKPGSIRGQIMELWMRVYSVPPSESQMGKALVFLAEQTESIRAAQPKPPASGKEEGQKSAPNFVDPQRLALASLGQALLGSNGFLYVE